MRKAVPSVLATGAVLLSLTGCKLLEKDRSKDFGPLDVIPDPIHMVINIDPKGLVGTPLEKPFNDLIDEDSEARAIHASFEECGYGLANIDKMILAGGTDDALIVLVADGLGTEDTVKCIHDAYKVETGDDPWRTELKKGEKRRALTHVDTDAYLVNDDILVFADRRYSEGVLEILHGEGQRATDSSLKPVLERVDQDHGIWFSLAMDADLRNDLADIPGAGNASAIAGSVDLGDDLTGHVTLVMGSAPEATKAADELKGAVDEIGPALGLPSDGLELSAKEENLVLDFKIPATVVETLLAAP